MIVRVEVQEGFYDVNCFPRSPFYDIFPLSSTGCPSKFSIEKLRWITLTTKCTFTTHTYTKTTPNIFFPGLNHPCRTNTNNFRDLFFFRFCKMATWFYPHSELRITIKKSMRRLIDALRKIPLEKSNQEMFMSEQV